MNKITKIGLIYTINDGQEILCVKKQGLDVWISPGGKLNPNESHEACLARELDEELNIFLGELPAKPYMVCKGIAEGTTDIEIELFLYKARIDTFRMKAQNEIEYYVYAPIVCYKALPLAWSLKNEVLPALAKEYDL